MTFFRKTLCRAAILALTLSLLVSAPACARVFDLTKDENAAYPYFEDDAQLLEIWIPQIHDADAALILCGGHSALIDTGDAKQVEGLVRVIAAFSDCRVDDIFLSHPHHDHLGGFKSMLDRISVGRLLTGFRGTENSQMQAGIDLAAKSGITVGYFADGDVFQIGDATLTVLMCSGDDWSLNDRSAVMRLQFGDASILFMADTGSKTQSALLRRSDAKDLLRADIIKAPHHGITKLSSDFLAAADPELVLITNTQRVAGVNSNLTAADIPIVYTCTGVTHLITDGVNWAVEQIEPEEVDALLGDRLADLVPSPALEEEAAAEEESFLVDEDDD